LDAIEEHRAGLALPCVMVETIEYQPASGPAVQGFLHRPSAATTRGIVLAHGAGSNATAPILVSACTFFSEAGFLAMRINLPFRQRGGTPAPSQSGQDREGLKNAADFLRSCGASTIVLGGHSYGGRQATMLAAEDPSVADALLLLSYPLHPPNKPAQLRTAHLPELRVPCVFAHGTRDPFGSIDEMTAALALIPARHILIDVEKSGHDLKKLPVEKLPEAIIAVLGDR
jgi:predicted alpha/beta-hydrolase family hydrolase